jgi:hypothetical protein
MYQKLLMREKCRFATSFMLLTILFILTGGVAYSQNESTLSGRVVSLSRNTMTVRTAEGQYQVFVFDAGYLRPPAVVVGSQVRVTSTVGEDGGVRSASNVTLVSSSAPAAAGEQGNVPADVRKVERDIERAARKYRVGVRAGVALDPELILFGVQSELGPIFHPDITFRPNVEFAFGEVTALFALNPEIIYRLPLSSRRGRWSTYVGAGPGFNFIHQNFERTEGEKRIDFGDFHSDVGFNILGGIRYRSGMFTELRTSVYSDTSPTLRMVIGYNF